MLSNFIVGFFQEYSEIKTNFEYQNRDLSFLTKRSTDSYPISDSIYANMDYNTHQHYTNEFRQRKTSTPTPSNDVKSKITSFRLLRTSFLYQTKEFFNNSTLHGVRYIAETDRPFGERLMWFCFTVIGFISALVIIVSLWEKFQTNPTITGILPFFYRI